jgi:RHS repeat-associated protein
MKQFYVTFFLIFSLFVSAQTLPTGSSTEVGITSGELSVSLAGAANYTIPISVPPGINGIVPQISLSYSSQGGNGVVGYGWNIAGVSSITRIPSTKFHDGIIDPVDFDSYDRFALNGQRLIVKTGSGAYGADQTLYETESFSNLKIKSYGVHPNGANYGPAYFTVEHPDGSKAYYGNSTDSKSITDWAITYWESPHGVRISYTYVLANNVLDIASIKYGTLSTTTPINEIKFNYEPRSRPEQGYIAGLSVSRSKRLSAINVIGNGTGFRNYYLSYNISSLGYERLDQIIEKTGDNSKSYNPTVFGYATTSETLTVNSTASSLSVGEVNANNSATVSGDFDGDAKMDFVLYPTIGANAKKEFWLFNDISKSSSASKITTGSFDVIFPSSGLTSNGKMYHYQGITIAQMDTDLSAVNFKTYTNLSAGIGLDNTKKAVFPERFIENCYDWQSSSNNLAQQKFYFNGDFNGDGITDVMAIDKDVQEIRCVEDHYNQLRMEYYANTTGKVYFVNLDRRILNNSASYVGSLADYFVTNNNLVVNADSKIETIDVNGDGKTDILHFKDGKISIYSLNDNNQLEILWQTLDSDIKITQSVLPGDYNGDGKMDFLIPTSAGLYATGYVKFLSTGKGFVKTVESYPFANLGSGSDGGGIYTCSLIPLDINADGKTDIVQCRSVFGNAFNGARVMMNVFKNKSSSFIASSTYDTGALQAIRSYPLPVFLSPKTNNQYLSLGVISNNQIYTFDSKNDFTKEGLLLSITTGNGVKESITYSPLQQDPYEPLYTPTIFTETYPNIDIVAAPSFKIVTKVEQQSAGGYKKQLFYYAGAVTNAEGIGFIGFRSAMRTNWHNDSTTMISNISKNDISLRGANIENFSLLGYNGPYTATPSTFISRSVKGYNTAADALQANKVFKLKYTSETQYNGLEGTSSVTTTVLDQYNNPTSVTTLLKEGSSTIQTKISTISYKAVNALPYYIGVPATKSTSSAISGSSMVSEEVYGYTNINYGLLSQIKKKAGITTNYIIEDNIFDSFGNITKKTITATGLTPRVTSYVYDTSGRFLIKTTDIEGLFKTFDYNLNSGVLNSETNQNGLTTSYEYDSWFKKTKTTDYLGKSNTYTYSKSSEKSIITNVGDDNGSVEETFDDLGRKVKVRTKDVEGNFSSVDYFYDIYDRNYKTSEPYSGTNPTLFNTTNYDEYGRAKEVIAYTGKATDIVYSGLTTTVSDYLKSKVSVKNALGNVVSMTETPGGNVITYTYFANGNLKGTNYGGTITTVVQDGWGRKTQLTDPSAGTYKYEYNDFGEITKETTPNGFTSYKLDAYGKLDEKEVVAGTTDVLSQTKYTYDSATKLLLKTEFNDLKNTTQTTEVYTYDTSKRIIKKVETTPYAVFTKDLTYDAFGRVDTETSTASAAGKSSSKKIQYTYKNGFRWQILDALTSTVLWQINTVNAKGELKTAINGPITQTIAYDAKGYVSQFKYDKTAAPITNVLTLNSDFDALSSNLKSRTNSLFSRTETFKYDNLDRLTEYTNAQGIQETQSYDGRGRITQNSVGTYDYDATSTYRNKAIVPTAEALGYYGMREGILTDSMEDRTGWGTQKYPNTAFYSYDNTTAAHSGKNSLKLANTTTTEQYVFLDKWVNIENTSPTQYTYSAWFKSDNPQAEIFLYMKDAANLVTQINTVNNTKGVWTQIVGTFTVPATIKKLCLRLDNNGLGNIWFDDVQIRKTSDPTAATKALNVTYNTFKGPIEIEEAAVDKISFTYNNGNDRSAMFYGGLQTDKLLRTYRKFYSADGSMEVKHNMVTGVVEFVTYIGGDGYSASLVSKSDGTNANYLYLLRDYQGSIVAVSDATGAVVEKRLFDAWGNIVKVQDGAGNILSGLTVLDRGYTGHEHLQSVGIIHMNGRLYDPKLHRFLQPDNNIQDPFNTQNYNRYGYVLNNPLRYTDPSGEFWHIVAGAVIGGLVNWGVHGFRMDMEGLKAFGIGAGAGALGAATGGAAFGMAGGAAAGGGGFAAGFISGGVGAAYSTMFLNVGNHAALGDPLMSGKEMLVNVGIGALTGGVFNGIGALLNGKTFWTGTTTPRVAVQPVTVQTAGLTEIDGGNNIKTGDYKISSTTEPTTAPTNSTNTSTNISVDKGYVDLSNRPEFNKIQGFGDVKPTLKEVGILAPNNNGTGTPNSMYEYQTTSGKSLSQHFYNSKGNVEFEINFKPHGMFYTHGHMNSIPGNIASGHLTENHIPFMLIPKKYW